MIRFIFIDGQVCDGIKEFSFWDTIEDKYLSFCGYQMWDNKKDFIENFIQDKNNPYKDNIERFVDKIPKEFSN